MIFFIFCCTFFYIVVASCLLHNANVDACCGVKCVAVYMVRCPVDEKLIAKFQGSWDQGTSMYETVPLMFCCVYDQVSCGWEADCQVPGQLGPGNIHVWDCAVRPHENIQAGIRQLGLYTVQCTLYSIYTVQCTHCIVFIYHIKCWALNR